MGFLNLSLQNIIRIRECMNKHVIYSFAFKIYMGPDYHKRKQIISNLQRALLMELRLAYTNQKAGVCKIKGRSRTAVAMDNGYLDNLLTVKWSSSQPKECSLVMVQRNRSALHNQVNWLSGGSGSLLLEEFNSLFLEENHLQLDLAGVLHAVVGEDVAWWGRVGYRVG